MRFGDETFIPRLPTSRGYIPQTFVVWWAGLDSNQRIPKEGDLQSPAIAAMRPTHIEAEGWHRRSISLTALLFCCFWLASRSYRLLFDNTACLHLLTHRSLAAVAGFEPAHTRVKASRLHHLATPQYKQDTYNRLLPYRLAISQS